MNFKLSQISRELPVLIAGPTASGKSDMAMELAARDGRVIINADALQVYSCWRLLSARPSAAEEADLPHRLYGHIEPSMTYSVGHWLREIRSLLSQPAVIVGGTGLYFMALTEGLAEIPAIPAEVRSEADQLRLCDFDQMRRELDLPTLARVDGNNPARVQRAWEVLRATGRGLAQWQDDTPPPILARKDAEALVLRPDVEWLNARIDRRFDAMMTQGALAEAAAVLDFWEPQAPWAKAIGAPELVAYLQGHSDLDAAISAAKLASRQYAKRQRTWFRSRMRDWIELTPGAAPNG